VGPDPDAQPRHGGFGIEHEFRRDELFGGIGSFLGWYVRNRVVIAFSLG